MKNVLAKAWGQNKIGNGSETLQNIIETNENVLNYLRLLVEYVNSNPQIMNGREFAGRTSEAMGRTERSDFAVKLGIPMIKEPRAGAGGSTFYDYSMLKSHIDSGFAGMGNNMRKPFGSNSFGSNSFGSNPFSQFGLSASFAGPSYRSPLASSASSYGFQVPYQLGGNLNGAPPTITGAGALQNLIYQTVDELKMMGKNIDSDDLRNIELKTKEMAVIENELIKTASYLEQYKYMVELFKDYNSQILSFNTVKDLVEKQKDLLSKQWNEETTLVKILGSLQGLCRGKCDDFVNDDCEYEKATVNLAHLPPPRQPDCVPKPKYC
jgi:hypothetical protein